jgi:predicted 3-demethylubiquinone-9 3-methyltransferase (glyoxalase superfamily)
MQKITPFLWYDGKAEEAAKFYVSIFKNSRIKHVSHYGEGMPAPAGSVMTVSFELDGQDFIALNGGPMYEFTPAVSLVVNCEDQAEIDSIWQGLTDGGSEVQCGWLKDRYGLSGRSFRPFFPSSSPKRPGKSAAVMQALMQMVARHRRLRRPMTAHDAIREPLTRSERCLSSFLYRLLIAIGVGGVLAYAATGQLPGGAVAVIRHRRKGLPMINDLRAFNT